MMNSTDNRFSPQLEKNLRHAGWYPGRRVDDAVILEKCAPVIVQLGCRIFRAVIEVLREFGGLHITSFDEDEPDYFDPHYVNVWPVTGVPMQQRWFQLEWEFGEVLFPIADHSDGDQTLLLASSGKVYALGFGYFFAGNTFDEALENYKGVQHNFKRINSPEMHAKAEEGARVYDALMQRP